MNKNNGIKIDGYDVHSKDPQEILNVPDYNKYLIDVVDNLDEKEMPEKYKNQLKSALFTIGIIRNSLDVHNHSANNGSQNPLMNAQNSSLKKQINKKQIKK
jgi:hypothetical protein